MTFQHEVHCVCHPYLPAATSTVTAVPPGFLITSSYFTSLGWWRLAVSFRKPCGLQPAVGVQLVRTTSTPVRGSGFWPPAPQRDHFLVPKAAFVRELVPQSLCVCAWGWGEGDTGAQPPVRQGEAPECSLFGPLLTGGVWCGQMSSDIGDFG